MSKEVFIVDGIRTAIGNFGGTLAPVRADDLAAHAIKALIDRHPGLDLNLVEDVIMGCANQAGEDNRNVARMASLLAGVPFTAGGETVNRLCASGMAAANIAARAIKDGAGDIYIAGGVEHMTRGPWVISKTSTAYGRDAQMFDSSFGWRFINPKMEELYGVDGMGQTAENLVEMYGIEREAQDRFAAWSQEKATKAMASGYFAGEIAPVLIPQRKKDSIKFEKDEFIRPETTMDTLASLRPAFKKDGSVTAGNASGLNDGAAALLLASGEAVATQGFKPLARIVSSAVAGVEPRIMGIGPVYASEKALQRAGLTLDQIDVLELNEAFAVVGIANTKILGIDPAKVDVNGGAVALGHPLGNSGSRVIVTLINVLKQNNAKIGGAGICNGGGGASAMIIENI